MKIGIFGATGPTGQRLVTRALEAGHAVRVLARSPSKLGELASRVDVVQGDATDSAAVARLVAGCDAVACVLGVNDRKDGKTLSTATRRIVDAMKEAGVKRLVVQTSVGVGDSLAQAGILFGRIIKPLFLRIAFEDKERQETIVRESDLDWTIVRPTGLTNGPAKRKVRVAADPAGRVPMQISRDDVALFIVGELADSAHSRKAVVIGG